MFQQRKEAKYTMKHLCKIPFQYVGIRHADLVQTTSILKIPYVSFFFVIAPVKHDLSVLSYK